MMTKTTLPVVLLTALAVATAGCDTSGSGGRSKERWATTENTTVELDFDKVNEAFKAVNAAQQAAKTDVNNANAYALQMRQVAQGEATSFDKFYEQYKLAPEVTRRRLYYETMERVLRNVDKTIVETPGVTPYLPLNQVNRQAPAPRGGAQ